MSVFGLRTGADCHILPALPCRPAALAQQSLKTIQKQIVNKSLWVPPFPKKAAFTEAF
ncbi:hypothetical protein KTQ54_08990 [Komagataeibacter oboediens]|uniref:hypothetical protein n=1 Tax=Komagataeibacter oboediens TaxID=65958 RepID=UPI001C2CAFBD|nr:hypothetical protein [Komagataeibacter oboediens]MBV0888673.1 hypothetical protein [Komagataeibacter oboediens]MCK9821407.1 hypothetical protein [Komagataeibacter oboediens]